MAANRELSEAELRLPPLDDGRTAAGLHWLVYDGNCPFCRASLRLLKVFDWFGRLQPMDLHKEADKVRKRAPHLSHEAMMEAMHLITPAGQVYPGFFAVRQAAWSLPALWAALPLLYLPGMSRLGPAVYAWIARNRYGLVRCTPDGACRI